MTVTPIFEAGPFTVTLECQVENDEKLPKGNELQFIDGNLSGIILNNEINIPNNVFAQKFGKDFIQKLNFEYGKPGNGTYLDLQTIATLWSDGNKVNDCDAALDFEFTWLEQNGEKVPVISVTAELQRIIEESKYSTKYINALLKIEIDLSKLNIDPASYLFTHNISQYLLNINQNINYELTHANLGEINETYNPQRIYEVIKTLCYTFLKICSTQILLEMKNIKHEDVLNAIETISEKFNERVNIQMIAKSLILIGFGGGTYKIMNLLIAAAAIGAI
ncbi:MAG: hypothetical protein ACRDD2_10270 [Sarcina sp.]